MKIKLLASFANCLKTLPLGFIDIFYFPFDHNQPLPPNALSNEYLPILEFLNKSNVEYFITDGSLLGLYRDHRLIPHDNDFDIALKNTAKLFNIVFYCFRHGWMPGRILFSLKTFKFVQLIFHKNNAILDFCIWTQKGDSMHLSVPEVHGLRSQPAYYYSAFQYITIGNLKFKTHLDPQSWLKLHYGDTWNVPKHTKGDWREDTNDIIC